MEPARAYNLGFLAIWKNKRVWLFFYGLNFVLALLVAYPLRVLISGYFAHSGSLQKLVVQFDYMALVNFLRDNGSALSVLFAVFFLVGLVYWLLHYFFAGGALGAYLLPEREKTFPEFFRMSAFYFPPMFRLFLFSLVFILFTIVIHLLLLQGLAGLKPHISNEILSSFLRASVWGVTALIFLFFKMIVDYAKASVVLSNRRSALTGLVEAFRFAAKHFLATTGLFYLIILTGLLFFLLYLFLNRILWSDTQNAIGLIFVFQQILVLIQTAIRLQFFAAQGHFLKMAKTEAVF